ncbi:hydroxymethylbilane synthase [Sinorhizobium meliloti]|uniref:hydroxymethylbilane synthase n=1 Tax=Rhizobium meliloti TaxID=382 RepID=UPI003D658E69
MRIRIATRSSKLALWQAEFVRAELMARHSGIQVGLLPVTTTGDTILGRPLRGVDGKALFIKELEEAMLRGEAEMAVHCMKDFHRATPEGFALAAILERGSDRDMLLSREPIGHLDDLAPGAVVGTTSLRRAHEVKRHRPDITIRTLRGNVTTRHAALLAGEFDAIVLAEAGFQRLGMEHGHCLVLSDREMLPCAGQGALGIEILAGAEDVRRTVSELHHEPTNLRVRAERAFIATLGADCGASVGVSSRLAGSKMVLCGFVGNSLGTEDLRETVTGTADAPEHLGSHLGNALLRRGADKLLGQPHD